MDVLEKLDDFRECLPAIKELLQDMGIPDRMAFVKDQFSSFYQAFAAASRRAQDQTVMKPRDGSLSCLPPNELELPRKSVTRSRKTWPSGTKRAAETGEETGQGKGDNT